MDKKETIFGLLVLYLAFYALEGLSVGACFYVWGGWVFFVYGAVWGVA